MEIDTYLSESIDIADEKAKYDACVKELLADKQILARILKGCLKDFEDDTIEEIISYMDEPQISTVPVHPIGSADNLGSYSSPYMTRVQKTSEEDNNPTEGAIYFDIRFSLYHRKKKQKFLIGIEAQKSTNPSKLGYYIENRFIYYITRMVSSQKGVEFFGSNYDDIKAVRSIWIFMDGEEDEDSIEIFGINGAMHFGKRRDAATEDKKHLELLDKLQIVNIILREKSGGKKSDNELIAMLEELFGDDSPEDKKRKLEEDYGLVMKEQIEGRVQNMCNWSDNIWERGIEQGIERGIEQGIERGIEQGIERGIGIGEIHGREEGIGIGEEKATLTMIKNLMESMNFGVKQAMDALQIPAFEQEKYMALIK